MRVAIHPTAEEAASAVADRIAAVVRARPDAVLGLATGGTMEPVYARLVRAHRRDGLSFARVTTVNLDEYVGLPAGHPQGYRAYMRHHLLDHVDLASDRAHLPRADLDPNAAAARYETLLARVGPIDLQLLGLGRNGHIGFNEPGSPFDSRTRVVDLAASTVEANRRFFPSGQEPPARAVSMGVGSILAARALVLLAVGRAKAASAQALVDGPVTPDMPATALRLHADATVVLDAEAAGGLAGRA